LKKEEGRHINTSIIVAMDKNKLIGKDNVLPWSISEDLKLFRKRTLEHVVIMGRVTWDNLPKKPLKDRLNIVISRIRTGHECFRMGDKSQMVYFQPDLKAAIKFATWYYPDNNEIFIIGGKQIYETALNENLVDKMYITEIHGDYEGDVYFPPILDNFKQVKIEKHEQFNIMEYGKSE